MRRMKQKQTNEKDAGLSWIPADSLLTGSWFFWGLGKERVDWDSGSENKVIEGSVLYQIIIQFVFISLNFISIHQPLFFSFLTSHIQGFPHRHLNQTIDKYVTFLKQVISIANLIHLSFHPKGPELACSLGLLRRAMLYQATNIYIRSYTDYPHSC